MNDLDSLNKKLDELILKLNSKEEYFKKCLKCPNKGKCCIDNDIDIRDDEWAYIKKYLLDNEDIYKLVYDNFKNGRRCYFRTDEKCLIHDIRPLNCKYTPYQMIYKDGHLIYHISDDYCNFSYQDIICDIDTKEDIYYDFRSNRYYILLNNFIDEYYDSLFYESHTAYIRLYKLFRRDIISEKNN